MFTVARKTLASGCREDHEDLVSEAMLDMWRFADRWKPERGDLRGYLIMIGHRKIKQVAYGRKDCTKKVGHKTYVWHRPGILDKQQQQTPVEFDNPFWNYYGGSEDASNPSLSYHYKEIVDAINSLPPKTREYVKLRFFEGLSGPEIQDRMGLNYNPSGLWSNRDGARLKLKEALAHLEGVV